MREGEDNAFTLVTPSPHVLHVDVEQTLVVVIAPSCKQRFPRIFSLLSTLLLKGGPASPSPPSPTSPTLPSLVRVRLL